MKIKISKEQADVFAELFKPYIRDYIENHQAEFDAYLATFEKSVKYLPVNEAKNTTQTPNNKTLFDQYPPLEQ